MFFLITTTQLNSIPIQQRFDGHSAQLIVIETDFRALLGLVSSTVIRIDVINEVSGKKINRKEWDSETLKIAEQTKQRYQPSFFKRIGKVILVVSITIGVLLFAFGKTVYDHKQTEKNAIENFAQAYDEEARKVWLDALKSGDFILANKDYNEPAQVYQIESFTDSTVVMKAFDQFIPFGGYEALDKLNAIQLGNTTFKEVTMVGKYLSKGILEDVKTTTAGLDNKYIKQIKKK